MRCKHDDDDDDDDDDDEPLALLILHKNAYAWIVHLILHTAYCVLLHTREVPVSSGIRSMIHVVVVP